MNGHTVEVEAGRRFEFGKNWRRYLRIVNEERIKQAEESLKDMLGVDDLRGKRFIGTVSVFDRIANTGPQAKRHLKSKTPNIVTVS